MSHPSDPKSLTLTAAGLRRLGSRIADRRGQRGWKQIEVSRRTGIHPTRLSRLEKGASPPKLDELIRLRAALGMDLEEIVFGEEAGAGPAEDLLREVGELQRLGTVEELAVVARLLRLLIRGYRGEPGAAC